MVPIMWKFPTKPWFLRGCLILGGRDYDNYIYIYIIFIAVMILPSENILPRSFQPLTFCEDGPEQEFTKH